VTKRHWRSYGTDPLPTPAEPLTEPLRALPSWFLRIVCERCGKERMLSETHMPRAGDPRTECQCALTHPILSHGLGRHQQWRQLSIFPPLGFSIRRQPQLAHQLSDAN